MTDIFDLRARVSADATPFNQAMDSSATSVSSALSSINSAASTFIGSGVVRVFSRATDAAYEFGQVMADISSISDVGIQQLSKNIKQLDNVYGSMSNVGNSIYNMISSGFDRSEDALLSMEKAAAHASKSVRGDLYTTTNAMTTLANAYNLTANDFEKIADMMFVTVKEGKAEGNELARTLGLVVNTASEAGLSLAEMSAVISTLSRTQTTSQAMIGFNQMLNAMIKPSKEAADTAAQFGIEFGAAALKSKGFTAIIKDMHDKLQGNVEAINKISGPIRAMRAVVSLTGKQYENFIDILEKAESQIGTGVAMEAFAKQTNTAKQALENLKVQIDKTFVGVGQDIEPITRHLAEFSEIFLKTFGNGEDGSLGGLGRWSFYISAIIKVIREVHEHVSELKNLISKISSGTKDTSSTIKTTETSSKNIIDTLPKALTKVQDIRKEIQTTANLLDSIALRLTNVSDISSKIKLQRALVLNPAEVRRTAEANLGIKAGNKKYKDTAPSAKDRYAKAQTIVLNRHGLSAEFLTTPLIAQALNRLGLQSNPFNYKAMTGSEMHKKAMAYASPKEAFKFGYERVNEFALNLDKAVRALENFSTSVSNVKTKLDAAMLPADARKVAMAQLYKTEAQLFEQAKRNVDMSYVRVGENGLRDPLSGKFVSRTAAEADELYRLRAELNKARGQVRRDAKTQTIINDESEERYNKAIEVIQRSDLRKTQENASQRKAVAEEILELRRQRRDIDAEITKAATAEDEAYWRNLRIDNANRTAIAKEMLRIRKLRQQEADAIAKEIKAHEDRVKCLRERKALKTEDQTAYDAEVRKRFYRRFNNAVPTKDLGFLGKITRKVGVSLKTSFDQILGKGSALSKMYNGFFAVTSALAAWETGLAIGKSLGEKLKVADWWLTKWIAELSVGKLPGSTDKKQKELEEYNLSIMKKSLRVRADRLFTEGKLTETEHAAIVHELNLADATEALTRVRNRLANIEKPKEEPKPVKTRDQVETENRKIKEEELNKAKEGKYKLNAESEDRLVKVINEYDLPKNVKNKLLDHFSGENWSKEFDVAGSSDYRTKLDVVKKYVNSHVYTDDKGNPLDHVNMNLKRSNVITKAHSNLDLLNELYKNAIDPYALELRKWRKGDVKSKEESQIKSAKYRGVLRSYQNTLNNERTKYERERPNTLDPSNYKQSDLDVSTLDNEANDIASTAKLFEDSATNFEARVTAYNAEVEYLRSMAQAMKGDGISDEDIKVTTALYKNSLDTFKKSLESERKALLDLAKQQSELPERLSEQSLERAKLLGIDTSSAKFLRGRVKTYEQESTNNLGVYTEETALQQELRLRYARAYQEIADEAFNALMKSRENVRQNKVSAGVMTESMATRSSITDLQDTIKRIKESIAQLKDLRNSVDEGSIEYHYYSNRIASAQGKLADTSIKLRGEFNKLSEKSNEVRKGLMNTIQGFTQQRDTTGKMTNDALWHSVNLASRMGGMVRSQPYMISTRSLPNRQKSAQMRQQAQGAVSASVDAWIMSQKYAEANVGKTVADIYTFMKQNNTIVVRNK